MGFREKILKMKQEVYDLQEKRNRDINERMEEFKTKLISLQKVIDKGNKAKNKQLHVMGEVTNSTLQE